MNDVEKELYTKAIELSSKAHERFLDLARTLRRLKEIDQNLFLACVADSDIGLRKAYYILSVERRFAALEVPDDRLMAKGWTKLQVIAGHVTTHNVEKLLKLAEQENTRDLRALMKGEEARARPHCVLMYFTEEQFAQFADAVVEFGGARDGRALLGKEEAIIAQIQDYKRLVAWFIENLYRELARGQ